MNRHFIAGDIFFENALDALSTAYGTTKSGSFHLVVGYAQAAIEYSFKALTCFYGVKPKREHDPGEVISRLLDKKAADMEKPVIGWLLEATSSANMVNKTRQYAEYGIPDQGIASRDLFDNKAAQRQLELATAIYSDCCTLARKRICPSLPKTMRIGILDGTVTGERKETGHITGAYTRYGINDWNSAINSLRDARGDPKYATAKIPTLSANSAFHLIVNPFGENYPEIDYDDPLSFRALLSYVRRGGILMNAGGLAFWYAFMVGTKKHPTYGRQVPMYDPKDRIVLYLKVDGKDITHEYVPFQSGLLFRSSGIGTTGGDPTNVLAFQKPEDIDRCGDVLSDWKGQYVRVEEAGKLAWKSPKRPIIREFRSATISERWCPLIPLVRAERTVEGDVQNVLPVVAARLGAGFLVHAGMDLSEDRQRRGLRLLTNVIDGFLNKMAFKSDNLRINTLNP